MKRISIDNGATFDTVRNEDDVWGIFQCILDQQKISYGSMWCNIVNLMDDGTREKAHELVADHCWTEAEFLLKYLELANEDLIIG